MADELSSKLGFDVSEALSSINKLKRELDGYNAAVAKMATTTGAFNAEGAKIDSVLKGVSTTLTLAAGQLRQYASASNAAATAATNFSRASRQAQVALGRGVILNQPLGEQVKKVVAAGPTAATAKITPPPQGFNPIAKTEADLRNLFRKPIQPQIQLPVAQVQAGSRAIALSWGSVIKVFGTQFAYRAVGSIVGAYTSAIEAGRKYELQLAEIQTLSQEFASAGLDKVGAAVSKLSAEFGQPIEGVAKGLYESLSNQIGNAAESTRFLAEALSFSRSSLTSTADSVDLLSGVINSYGLTASSTADISDKLFRTIDLGRVRGEELANTIGRVLPLSAALGVSFEEVAASLAHLTIQGVKANDAQTQITNVMLKLIRPTQALKAEFQNLGIATPEAAVAAYGFQGALEKLTESGGTSATEIGKLFNQIRGTRGVIGLVATDAEKYKKTLDEISNGSKGASEAAAGLIQNSNAGQLTKQLTEARNFLVNDFGRTAVDQLSKFIAAIGGGERAMQLLGAAVALAGVAVSIFAANAGIAFGSYVVGALRALGATEALTGALARLGIGGAALTTLGLAAAGVILYFGHTSDEADKLDANLAKLSDAYDRVTQAEIKAMQPQIDAQKAALTDLTSSIEQYFFSVERLYEKDKQAATKAQMEISNDFRNQLKERESDLDKFISVLQEIQDKPAKTKQNLDQDLLASEFSANAGRFERTLQRQGDPAVQGRMLAQRSQKVLDAAREAIGKGNTTFGKDLISQSMGLAERSASITQTRFIGEGQVNRVLMTQKELYGQIVAIEQQQADGAKKVETEQRGNIDNVKNLIKEYNELSDTIAKTQLKPGTETNAAQLKSLQDRQKVVGEGIDKGLKAVSTANLPSVLAALDLDKIQRRLATPFTSAVSGKPTTLQLGTDEGSQKVIGLLTKWEKGLDVDLRLHIMGLTGQTAEELAVSGTKEAQEETAKLNRELQKLTENQKEGVSAGNDFRNAQAAIAASLKAIDNEARAISNKEVRIGGVNVGALQPFANRQETPEIAQARSQFRSLGANANAALGTQNPQQIAAVQAQIQRALTQAREAAATIGSRAGGGTPQALVRELTNLATAFDAAASASAKTRKVNGDLNSLNQGTQQLRNLRSAELGSASAATIFVNSTSEIGEAARAQVSGVEALTRAQEENAAAAANAGGPVRARAMGGPVSYYDMGGFVPRGSDRIPAMLGSDEFVVNAGATRKFYSQLVAMNSGGMPTYRAQGGPVTVGDVHVNVTHNQSAPMNGRQIATELRRELRRNVSFVY